MYCFHLAVNYELGLFVLQMLIRSVWIITVRHVKYVYKQIKWYYTFEYLCYISNRFLTYVRSPVIWTPGIMLAIQSLYVYQSSLNYD